MTGGYNKRAEKLIRELEESSERRNSAAQELREALEYDWEDFYDGYLSGDVEDSQAWNWDYGQEP